MPLKTLLVSAALAFAAASISGCAGNRSSTTGATAHTKSTVDKENFSHKISPNS